MFRSLYRAMVLAIAIGFAMAPLVLAQTSGTGSTGSMEQSRPATGTTGQAGTTGISIVDAQDAMQATIAEVNHQKNTVKLRMQGGETVELKVPEQSLMNLNKGDSVQVSIRKADTSSMPQAYQGSSTPGSGAPGAGTYGSGTRPR